MDRERLTTHLSRLAAVVALLKGDPLKALRAAFSALLKHANLDKSEFIPRLLGIAAQLPNPHPHVTQALAAAAAELDYRGPAGWGPTHLIASMREHVPGLFERGDNVASPAAQATA